MVKIRELFLATVFLIITEIYCSKPIGNILSEYYESDLIKSLKEEWVKYKKPFENAIMTNIKENFGAKSMNIYKQQAPESLKITRGFYLSDNIVDVLFSDMILRDYPNLIMPDVSLSLPGNILKVEATVGKMFVDTVYRMMRNESAVLYSEADLQEAKHSPFSLQQVGTRGKLTIVAEDCFLSGFSIVTFTGNSVSLGHSTFRLVDCKFTVEISSVPEAPPVIAPYFPKGPGKQIESLLSRPIHDELVQNLQRAVYSYVNTSVVFGERLPEYRYNQQKLSTATWNYFTGLCDKLNNLTLEAQKGSIKLNDFEDRVETTVGLVRKISYTTLKQLKLYGLDTAYASRSGGSFESSQLSIADCIRFHSLQVRGKVSYNNRTERMHNFAVELADLKVNVIVNIEKEGSNSVNKFDVVFGRNFGFSVLPWETDIDDRLWYQALVSGYIINEIPACITRHLSGVLTPASNDDEQGMKFYEDNSEDNTEKVKIQTDDDDDGGVTKENKFETSIEEPNAQNVNEDEDQPPENPEDTISDNNASAAGSEKVSQEDDIGVMVTAPEALLESKETLISYKQSRPHDFFSDDNENQPVFSGVETEKTNKEKWAGDKLNDALDKNLFSNKGKKTLFSGIETDDKIDDVLDKDFFSDGKGKKSFFSDSDDDRKFIFDSDGTKNYAKSENSEDKNSDKSQDNGNDNSEMTDNKKDTEIFIFGDRDKDSDKLDTNNNDDISEETDQQSVPIERVGKNNYRTTNNATVNRKKPTTKIHKLNRKGVDNSKMTLKKNPRANTTKVQRGKHLQTSKHHNKTRSLKNELHVWDNEIHRN